MFFPSTFLHNSNIYEVNLRQYSAEGSINAFAEHLPRLKKIGVKVLWFMPIHPIGIKNRKGSLGSYYSVKDYTAVNSEFGSLADFKNLVAQAHLLGIKVIIDWVANHSSWDNVWALQENDFYVKDENGKHIQAFDWDDVIQINHNSIGQQNAMITAMQFWVNETDIDGFRADLAHLTPLPFWIKARLACASIKKDLIWLAETEEPTYQQAFDISYTWKWMHAIELFCKGEKTLVEAVNILEETNSLFADTHYRMYFTSNHDENSWNGTAFEKYADYLHLVTVFAFTFKGIPLVYSGEEVSNKKRLSFFDKDVIDWEEDASLGNLYEKLNLFRAHASCFTPNAQIKIYHNLLQQNILAYAVIGNQQTAFVVLNFSNQSQVVSFNEIDFDFSNFMQFGLGDALFVKDEILLSSFGFSLWHN
jgi:alpha-amylase